MRLSHSGLSDLTKCGYKYYLKKIEGVEEPGKKKYALLQGDIVGVAVQDGCQLLFNHKEITDDMILSAISGAYGKQFQKAGVDDDLTQAVIQLVTQGSSPELMNDIDFMADALNATQYEYKAPNALKNVPKTGYSTDKRRLGMMVVKTIEDIYWFFHPSNPVVSLIKGAAELHHEFYYKIPFGEPVSGNINGKEVEFQDEVDGYLDQLIVMPDGRDHISEFKYVKTPYEQYLVNHDNQLNGYFAARGYKSTVRLFDIKHQQYFQMVPNSELINLTKMRYEMGFKMLQNGMFLPACGLSPYATKSMMCGYRHAGCPYGGGDDIEMEE